MKGKLHLIVFLVLWKIIIFSEASANNRWQSNFDTTGNKSDRIDSVLTLNDVINLVAVNNPTLRSLGFIREIARGQLKQAGMWRNPEFGSEFEEVGWDSPGLSESEITISLSQEFEIFGQRDARKQVAISNIKSTDFEMKLAAFDLYLETKSRFNKLLHSQRRAALADSSVLLAESIVNSIEYRMKNGVALESEFLLAQLELQRTNLKREEMQQELFNAQIALSALWNSHTTDVVVYASEEPDLQQAIDKLPTLAQQLDSTRFIRQLHFKKEMTQREKQLASKEMKPAITLSGGYKRLEFNNSNSFLFGFSLPLPFFNRNQGEIASLEATLRSQEFEQERIRLETKAKINSTITKLNRLVRQHITLDTLLLPTAENAYKTLKETYNVGRIPYTSLLEAERSLIELRFEHNDILFVIHEQLISLEMISGVKLY